MKRRELEQKLENLTNDGMIDLMWHQFKRFEAIQKLTFVPDIAIWKKWIRR